MNTKAHLCSAFVAFVAIQTGIVTGASAEEVTTSVAPASDVKADDTSSNTASPTTYHGEPFTFDASFGWQAADLTTFRSSLGAHSFTASVVPAQISGPTAQVGIGLRFYVLTFGLRASVGWLTADQAQSSLDLSSIDAEFGLRLPFDRVEAYLLVGGGYSVIGGLSDAVQGLGAGLNIDGGNLRAGLGVDYFFSKYFSVGIRGNAEALFLARRGVALRDLPQASSFSAEEAQLLAGSGSTVGTSLSVTAGPGLHF